MEALVGRFLSEAAGHVVDLAAAASRGARDHPMGSAANRAAGASQPFRLTHRKDLERLPVRRIRGQQLLDAAIERVASFPPLRMAKSSNKPSASWRCPIRRVRISGRSSGIPCSMGQKTCSSAATAVSRVRTASCTVTATFTAAGWLLRRTNAAWVKGRSPSPETGERRTTRGPPGGEHDRATPAPARRSRPAVPPPLPHLFGVRNCGAHSRSSASSAASISSGSNRGTPGSTRNTGQPSSATKVGCAMAPRRARCETASPIEIPRPWAKLLASS